MTDHFQPNAGTAPQTVFHGSRVVVETPRILPSRCTKDFGPGFSCANRPRRCPVIDYDDLFYVCSLIEFIGRERKLRLIEDVADGADPVAKLVEVYSSWMSDALSRFNSDLYYQSRGYLAECHRAGTILVA